MRLAIFVLTLVVFGFAPLAVATPMFYVLGQDENIYSISANGTSTLQVSQAGGSSLAVDAAGNFYVDSPSFEISKITPAGVSSVYSSIPTFGNYGLIHPGNSLVFDQAGDLYDTSPADGIVAVTPAGAHAPALVASALTYPGAEVVNSSGNLFVTSNTAGVVYEINQGVVSTFASGFTNQNNGGLAFGADGTLYAASYGTGLGSIVKLSSTGAVTPFVNVPGEDFGVLAFSPSSGDLYAATQYDTIVQITPAGSVSTFATLPTFALSIVNPVPEPGCLGLLGAATLTFGRRRSKKIQGQLRWR